jgi:hypothetical protein
VPLLAAGFWLDAAHVASGCWLKDSLSAATEIVAADVDASATTGGPDVASVDAVAGGGGGVGVDVVVAAGLGLSHGAGAVLGMATWPC